jgi:hypothetical protein
MSPVFKRRSRSPSCCNDPPVFSRAYLHLAAVQRLFYFLTHPYLSIMGKYDHIPELTGTDNYIAWETQVQLALMNDDLWCHVTDKVDPQDILGSATYLPVPATVGAPTDDEKIAMRTWLINDSKAKTILLRRLAPGVSLLIPRTAGVTAHLAWKTLRDHFHRSDVSSQYVIRRQIQSLHMKDSLDGSRYVGQHISYRDRLIGMGATYSDEEAVFHLLTGLPTTSAWQQFRTQLEQRMHDNFSATMVSAAVATGAPVPATIQTGALTFENCAARITAEAARQVNAKTVLSGPGSEYSNAAVSSMPTSTVNPITGLRKHKNNPDGILRVETWTARHHGSRGRTGKPRQHPSSLQSVQSRTLHRPSLPSRGVKRLLLLFMGTSHVH